MGAFGLFKFDGVKGVIGGAGVVGGVGEAEGLSENGWVVGIDHKRWTKK